MRPGGRQDKPWTCHCGSPISFPSLILDPSPQRLCWPGRSLQCCGTYRSQALGTTPGQAAAGLVAVLCSARRHNRWPVSPQSSRQTCCGLVLSINLCTAGSVQPLPVSLLLVHFKELRGPAAVTSSGNGDLTLSPGTGVQPSLPGQEAPSKLLGGVSRQLHHLDLFPSAADSDRPRHSGDSAQRGFPVGGSFPLHGLVAGCPLGSPSPVPPAEVRKTAGQPPWGPDTVTSTQFPWQEERTPGRAAACLTGAAPGAHAGCRGPVST